MTTVERDGDGNLTWRTRSSSMQARDGRRDAHGRLGHQRASRPRPSLKDHRYPGVVPQSVLGRASDEQRTAQQRATGGIDGSGPRDGAVQEEVPQRSGAPLREHVGQYVGMPALAKNAYNGEWLGDHASRSTARRSTSVGTYGQPWTRPGHRRDLASNSAKAGRTCFRGTSIASSAWRVRKAFGGTSTSARSVRTPSPAGGAYFRKPRRHPRERTALPVELRHDSHAQLLQAAGAHVPEVRPRPTRTTCGPTTVQRSPRAFVWDTQLIEGAAAYVNSYDLDHVTTYPLALGAVT